MIEELDISVEESIDNILKVMTDKNEKINVSQVAKRLSISNSAIYKFYPSKIFDIKTAQNRQKLKAESITLGAEAEKLTKDIANLKELKAKSQKLAKAYKKQNETLWEHIQQVYSMYDEMLAERNGFAERLKHMK
jgi:pyruvate-formate lyase